MQNVEIHHIEELHEIAKQLIPYIEESKIVLLYGEMGAGKTSLIKALCAELGYEGEVTSPTYSLVNEYNGSNNIIYHFDLFRLKSQEEALDIGIEEYLDSDQICFIEWPQKIEDLCTAGLKIEIEKIDFNSRKISIFKF